MKRKLISLALAALMAVPFAVFANAADNAPAEPVLTSNTVVYNANSASIVYDDGTKPSDKNDGLSWDKAKTGWGAFDGKGTMSVVKDGGTIVSIGRAYVGIDYTFPKATSPILITAVIGDKDYRSNEIYNEDKTKNGSQRGTFIGDKNKTITFAGDYIFDDIDILVRGASFTMSVADGANLVIADGVEFCNMAEANIDNYATNSVNPTLNVDKGGYAFLHQVGFSAYTGEGTLVIDEALKSEVEPLLANYAGTVVYVKAEADTTDSTTTTDTTASGSTTAAEATTTAPTDNPTTGDMTVVFAALAALSVAIVASFAVAKKKREN